jgi:hypothetical protein
LDKEKEKEAIHKKVKDKKDKKGRKSPAKSPSKVETPPPRECTELNVDNTYMKPE